MAVCSGGSCAARFRDMCRCMRNIESFSDGQATIANFVAQDESEEDPAIDLSRVYFDITPKEGPFKDKTFLFKVELPAEYPSAPPIVTCLTTIYHPNIDPTSPEQNVCLNLLDYDEWTSYDFGLEDVVQGLLFLLYNPELEDPNSPYFDGYEVDDWEEDVKNAMEGKNGDTFDPNYVVSLEEDEIRVISEDKTTESMSAELREILGKMEELEKEELKKEEALEPDENQDSSNVSNVVDDEWSDARTDVDEINESNANGYFTPPSVSRQISKTDAKLIDEDLTPYLSYIDANNNTEKDEFPKPVVDFKQNLMALPEFDYLLTAVGATMLNVCSVR